LDNISKTFFIEIFKNFPGNLSSSDLEAEISLSKREFEKFDTPSRLTLKSVLGRKNQPKFKFNVIKRYSPKCALCGISVYGMLQAAHIIPKQYKGSDDPRNGIVLCAKHHLAFDSGLFAIAPNSHKIYYRESYNERNLMVNVSFINHLINKPHADALNWRNGGKSKYNYTINLKFFCTYFYSISLITFWSLI